MAVVYWIHLPEHTDMFSEGYIGVTENIKRRYYEHLKLAQQGSNITLSKAILENMETH